MRRIWITDEPYPADDVTCAAAAAAGATEIVHGITPALATLGVTTLGYHELDDPPPPPDPRAELLARIEGATMLDEIRDIVADAISGGLV